MKLKKFFAGVLAAAMMLTVGATAAFATEGNNAAQAPTSIGYNQALESTSEIPLYKTYEVKDGTAPAETFSFQVKYLQVIRQDKAATAPYATETVINLTGKETAFDSMTKGSKSKSFTVTPTELGLGSPTGTGKYLYEISENAGQTVATTYAAPVYMAVTVAHKVDAETNQIKTGEYEYYVTMFSSKDAAISATGDSATGKVNNTEAFTNTYGDGNLYTLTLDKTVQGNFGDLGDTFTFVIEFTGDANKYANVVVETNQGTIKNADDEAVTSLALNTPYTITLGHNKKIVFNNLPKDIGYKIYEKDTTADSKNGQYTVSVADTTMQNVTIGENTVLGVTNSVNNANVEVHFVNTHEGTPDMGVVLDNAPYIAMLAIVAIGGVALMLNKRRRDEE